MDIDVHEFAVLDDGRRLTLHHGRGFSTSATHLSAVQARSSVLTAGLAADAGTAAAVVFVYGITQAGNPRADFAGLVTPLVAALALVTAFLLIERQLRMPLLPLRMLRLRTPVVADVRSPGPGVVARLRQTKAA